MCGICGIVGPRPGRSGSARAHDPRTSTPRARRRGFLRRDLRRTVLASASDSGGLSIIDLETGNQPIANEDGTVQLVFNGEIYNFRELRAELEARGHRFATNADTEVIVHLYEELGARCVERLNGMFAFALWDAARRELVLARDRFGKKPLYYAELGDALLFGSELKALLAAPGLSAELDLDEPLSLPGARVRARAARRSSRRAQAPGGPRPALARRPDVGRAVLGPRFDSDADARTDDEYAEELASMLRAGGPAPPGQRRAARRVPQRRHRLELGRRDDGRGAAGRRGQDLLDRLRRAELRRVGARTTRRAALRHRPPRGGLHARGDARPAPDRGRLPRRAVRRRVDPAHLPAVAVHARVT